MHGIECDDAVRNIEFTEQLLRGRDLVGLFRDIDVRQDQTGFDVEACPCEGGGRAAPEPPCGR
jgi:hypothetical protein